MKFASLVLGNSTSRTALASFGLILAAALGSSNGMADGTNGSSFGADDPAMIGCDLLAKMYERAPTGTERQFYNWAQGYFSGRSIASPSAGNRELPASGAGRERDFQQLLSFCAKNPGSTFRDAVVALWQNAAPAPEAN